MAVSKPNSYQVLARRYRPQLFRDVVGQQAVVQQLHNEITDGRIGHGYLFCGPRGTGKTSMARIFAKALNCTNGPTTEPCGKCTHCLEIAGGTHLDVIEVDAATYTKVDDMRELLGGVNRSPFSAKYKVYIIDEVHMLSNSSFNALLKNLEEPPPHVVFILATTNPEKIPETVISRCRRCNFDRIAMNDITRSLSAILDREEVKVDESERQAVLGAIALASDGGLRDAQVMLDQVISLTEDELRLDTVRLLLGVVEGDLFARLLKSLVEHNTQDCLLLIGDLVNRGRDLQRFVKMFLGFLRDAMILKAGGSEKLLRIVDPANSDFRAALDRTTLPFLLNAVQQFLDLEERMRGAAPPRFLLEFALIKLTAIDPHLVIDAALGGLLTTGDRPPTAPSGTPRPARQAAPAQAPASRPPSASHSTAPRALAGAVLNDSAVTRAEATAPVAIQTIHTHEKDLWGQFVELVASRNPAIRGVMTKARPHEIGESKLTIQMAVADRASFPLMERPEIVALIRDAARSVWGRPLMPRYVLEQAGAEAPPGLLVSPEEPEMAAVIEMPAPQPWAERPAPARSETPPVDVRKAITFQQALQEYPEFREACDLLEQHLGVKPVLFNGRRIG